MTPTRKVGYVRPQISLRPARQYFRWTCLSALSGVLAGIAAAVFLILLDLATRYRDGHGAIIWLLPIAGFFIGWIYSRRLVVLHASAIVAVSLRLHLDARIQLEHAGILLQSGPSGVRENGAVKREMRRFNSSCSSRA